MSELIKDWYYPAYLDIYKLPWATKKQHSTLECTTATLDKKKYSLNYVPWLESLLFLNEHFPELQVDYCVYRDDENCNYYIYVRLVHSDNSGNLLGTVPMFFPVMDYSYNSLPNPGGKEINTAIQRATAKLIAIELGYGIHLYRRNQEDLLGYKEEETASMPAPSFNLKAKKKPTPSNNKEINLLF